MKKQAEPETKIDTIPTLNSNNRRTKAKDPFAKYDSYDPLSRFQNPSKVVVVPTLTSAL